MHKGHKRGRSHDLFCALYFFITRSVARFSKAFGPKASLVAFDAFGDLLFFNSKKK